MRENASESVISFYSQNLKHGEKRACTKETKIRRAKSENCYRGMWVFLPIASLLIPVITGNLKINEDGLNSQSRFQKDSKNAFASRINQLDVIVPKTWSETILAAQNDENKNKTRLTINDNLNVVQDNRKNKYTQQIDSDIKIVSKRNKIGSIDSWLYNNNKNPLQKRKATFQPWGGKRVIFYKPIPTIYQPIRMPFNKWYKKQGEEYLNLIIGPETKRSKFIDDATRQSESRGRYGSKRTITGGRTGRRVPFRSWGGKRSEEVVDLNDEELMLVENDFATNDYDAKVADIREIENVLDNKRAGEMNRNNHNQFHSWGGKRDFVYGTPLHSTTVNNETNNDFTTDEEADESNWLMPMPDKRSVQGFFTKTNYDPWDGKRNTKTFAFHLGDNYLDILSGTARGRQVFFPWGG